MSVLNSIPNIKIPYPVEGVIRTAQLDDTVAPTNSVQLAVNMNFDRVGAMITRLGVTQYADDLASEITSFGTLRNELIPPGYETLAQLGTTVDTVNPFLEASMVKVSDTKVAVFYQGADGDGWCQNYSVNETTGEIAPLGSAVEFDAADAAFNKAIVIDSQYVLNLWATTSGHGSAQIFDVSGDTIVPKGSPFSVDGTRGRYFGVAMVDSSHAIVFYQGASSHGSAVILALTPSTGTITKPGATLTFDATFSQDNSTAAIGDGIHFVNFWEGAGFTGFGQTFSVNTGTWAITAIGSPLGTQTPGSVNNVLPLGDSQHFLNAFRGTGGGFVAQTYNVDPSTFAVTAVGTPYVISALGNGDLKGVSYGDGEHFLTLYSTNAGTGFVQMLDVDPTTFTVTAAANTLSGYDFGAARSIAAADMNSNTVAAFWGDAVPEGHAAVFQSYGDLVSGRWLYAGYADKVANLPAGSMTWTDRRTGLATVSKPRFAQYLNYEWMVNGNATIGGDPVATSNGGNFGTDLVPVDFPKGDFISAGFEGRVWTADKTLGIISYTDIVQFIPPSTYVLTFNPDVNFISQLLPQTGETFTALFEVPRALLAFTENSIYRIYGASSVDAYPGYNVGTFSQESIIQTKTGIFFHHSSGFYQFDYGSQPVEISRRIIDFVKAIPRANYEDVTGVWDGYDNVEWSVGQVVVEGVVFANCVVRYTISTQVWTIYDYIANQITAMIYYDDGVNLNHLMGTHAGKTGAMDVGYTDFGQPFYFEFIDRWRAFTDLYYQIKNISGMNIYSENAAGATLMYQVQKSGPNAWQPFGTVTEANNSLLPNSDTDDFDVLRFRLVGNTKGVPVVVHGIEVTQITIKGQDSN